MRRGPLQVCGKTIAELVASEHYVLDGEYVLFGAYPQSKVTDEDTIE